MTDLCIFLGVFVLVLAFLWALRTVFKHTPTNDDDYNRNGSWRDEEET